MKLHQLFVIVLAIAFCYRCESGPGFSSATIQAAASPQRNTCHAFCNEQHGIVKGWTGPDRESMTEAQKDTDAHNKQYHNSMGDVGVLCE